LGAIWSTTIVAGNIVAALLVENPKPHHVSTFEPGDGRQDALKVMMPAASGGDASMHSDEKGSMQTAPAMRSCRDTQSAASDRAAARIRAKRLVVALSETKLAVRLTVGLSDVEWLAGALRETGG